jgi:uncharacterized phosphosugar-binding protein
MNLADTGNGIKRYYQAVSALQREVIERQVAAMGAAAAQMASTISSGGRIFIFGTGHSHMMAEEAFYRAGGLAAAVPIFSSALMLHEKATFGSHLERTEGLAEALLESYRVRPGEMMLIYSNSGVNQLPVEMAQRCKERGLFVVAICSLKYARVAPLSSLGVRLYEVTDLTIDNGALIWNCLLTECIQQLSSAGVDPPVFASLNMPGAAEHNQALLKKWRAVNPHL